MKYVPGRNRVFSISNTGKHPFSSLPASLQAPQGICWWGKMIIPLGESFLRQVRLTAGGFRKNAYMKK